MSGPAGKASLYTEKLGVAATKELGCGWVGDSVTSFHTMLCLLLAGGKHSNKSLGRDVRMISLKRGSSLVSWSFSAGRSSACPPIITIVFAVHVHSYLRGAHVRRFCNHQLRGFGPFMVM